MAINSEAREQAEARFNRKQLAKVEGAQAMAAYLTDARLMREKTERLRGERLARDAARQKIEALLPAVAKPPRAARKPANLAVSKAPKPGRKTKRPITSTTLFEDN